MKSNRALYLSLGLGLSLAGCGSGGSAAPAAPASPTPGAPTALNMSFQNINGMQVARALHTATLLADGRVLVVGGRTANSITNSAEVFDPASGTWTLVAPMTTPRMHHSAALLPSGLVLIIGGQSDLNGRDALASTELFDPIQATWSAGPDLSEPRSCAAVGAYQDGSALRILIAGGSRFLNNTPTSLSSSEVYLSDTNSIVPTSPMIEDRFCGKAVDLRNGFVLVQSGWTGLGGQTTLRPADSELFDIRSGTFSSLTMSARRADSSLDFCPLGPGVILAVGGRTTTTDASDAVEFFNHKDWVTSLPLLEARWDHSALPFGIDLYVFAGRDDRGVKNSFEILTPGQSFSGSPLHTARALQTATLLQNDQVLIAGGEDDNGVALAAAEILAPNGASVPGATPSPQPVTSGQTPPAITQVSPMQGDFNSAVSIRGSNFDPSTINNVVRFNGVPAPITNATATELSVLVPNGASSGPITVTVSANTATGPSFTVTGSSQGSTPPGGTPPSILFVVPNNAASFAPVSITGRDFGSQPTAIFNGVPAISIVSLNIKNLPFIGQVSELVTLVPPGATTGPLTVEANGLSSNPFPFTVR